MKPVAAKIQEKSEALAQICRRFGVSRLELFGSACTDQFDPENSDLDFLVEFLPEADLGPWLSRLSELQYELSQLYGRTVDIVMTGALDDPWCRREAEKTRMVLYDASQEPKTVA